MAAPSVALVGFSLIVLLAAASPQAGPVDPSRHPYPENAQIVHEAEHAVDHAWEVYHRAALGGTVASPSLQTEIEQHLHEARTLLVQAQEAAERGDQAELERLIPHISAHASRALEKSKEQKR